MMTSKENMKTERGKSEKQNKTKSNVFSTTTLEKQIAKHAVPPVSK